MGQRGRASEREPVVCVTPTSQQASFACGFGEICFDRNEVEINGYFYMPAKVIKHLNFISSN